MAFDPAPVAGIDALQRGTAIPERLSEKASDASTSQETTGSLTPGRTASERMRLRIRFEKAGDLRFVSHHDLMHCFERMFRRAAVAVRASQGFNPRPRMVFAQSLALGLVGRAEALEVELDEPLPPGEVHERLARQGPPGLTILSVRSIDPKTRVQVRRAMYRVEIPAECRSDLQRRIDDVLAAPACWIERTRPQKRQIDLRSFLCELHLKNEFLQMVLWVTPRGAARPEEVLELLGLGDVAAAGAVIERTYLELHDEVSAKGIA
jgi:radical SAM-linked protein